MRTTSRLIPVLGSYDKGEGWSEYSEGRVHLGTCEWYLVYREGFLEEAVLSRVRREESGTGEGESGRTKTERGVFWSSATCFINEVYVNN